MAVVNSGLRGVSDNTQRKLDEYQQGYKPGQAVTRANMQMMQAQSGKPGAYQESQDVINARNALNAWQNFRPGAYTSKYAPALESIMQQIQNPEEFKYEFNGDELFKYYADLYTQKGKQAAQDVMGQAAALTGGYGNSYAQAVGQQQYQQYLLDLYDKGMDLRNAAYQKYLNDRADLKDQFNMLQGMDESDYGRYRDTVGDWNTEVNRLQNVYNTERDIDYGKYRDTVGDWRDDLAYYTNLYNNERSFDYGTYADMLNTWMNQANAENADYWNQTNYDFQREQWQHQLDQEAAAAEAAAAAAAAARATTGSTKTVYKVGNDYYKIGDNGKVVAADASDMSGKVNINTKYDTGKTAWNDTHSRVNNARKNK